MSQVPRHILVIRLSALGDVAMLVPVLRQLLKNYPEIRISLLTRPFFNPLFSEFPQLEVVEGHFKNEHKGVPGLWKLSKELKALKCEAVADCHHVLRTRILKIFTGLSPWNSINKGRKEKNALTSGKIFVPLRTTHERYADVFRKMGYEIQLDNPIFPDKPFLPEKFLNTLANGKNLIGVAPFAAHSGKAYPLDKMKTVISGLKGMGEVILFGGGEGEVQSLNDLASLYDHVHTWAGKISFQEELTLIRNLSLMVSMDSGNAHLAAAYGIDTITLWGVTHPFAGFAPFNQDEGNSILADRDSFPEIPTSVYGNRFPKGYEKAISTITPEEVLDKVKACLDRAYTSS